MSPRELHILSSEVLHDHLRLTGAFGMEKVDKSCVTDFNSRRPKRLTDVRHRFTRGIARRFISLDPEDVSADLVAKATEVEIDALLIAESAGNVKVFRVKCRHRVLSDFPACPHFDRLSRAAKD